MSSKYRKSSQIFEDLNFHNSKVVEKNEIGKRLRDWSYQVKNLDAKPTDLCILPDNRLAVVNAHDQNITIFDAELNFIRKVDTNDYLGETFRPLRMTTNHVDRLYVTNFLKFEVIMMDLSFNKIKIAGSFGSQKNEFYCCNGIAYHKGKIYVADTHNARIQVLTEDLEFDSIVQLAFQPWIIKVSEENVACISRQDIGEIHFYEIDTFCEIAHYDTHGYSLISEINSYFVEFCHESLTAYIYEKDGSTFEKVDLSRLKNHFGIIGDGMCVFYNGSLILSGLCKKQLLRF